MNPFICAGSSEGVLRVDAGAVSVTASRPARAAGIPSSPDDPTITVTSLGDLGADSVLGVIYPPQVAIIGFGRIHEQPWAEGGVIEARSVVCASLAGDHRATDGLVGARFLDALARHLQSPETA